MSTRWRDLYRTVALQWLTATILFVLLTIASTIFYWWLDGSRRRSSDRIHNATAMKSLAPDEARRVFQLSRTIATRSGTAPWVGYFELPFHTDAMNIDAGDPLPTRRTSHVSNGGAKQSRTIWLFGGSTAFGYGVPDGNTVASNLQRELAAALPDTDVIVVNQAHLGHFSSQENALLQWVLRSGKRADLAIFLDGFNESRFAYDSSFNEPVDYEFNPARTVTVSKLFPPLRLVRALTKPFRRAETAAGPAPTAEQQAATAAVRYARNIEIARSVAAPFGVRTLFVWQPTPYDYFDLGSDPVAQERRAIYPPDPVMKPLNAHVKQSVSAPDFVFLADLFRNRMYSTTFVDSCHYGDEASAILGATIAREVMKRGLLDRADGR